jgi:prevent-host-death family protein
MTATTTATDYNREPSRILGRVERGDTIIIEKHGLPVAMMIPQPRRTSGAELARQLRRCKPAPKAADELEAIIKGMNDAGRRSYPD